MRRRAPQATNDSRFDQFWAAYPKRVAKGDARRAWALVNPDDQLFKQMLHAIDWQKHTRDWMKDGGQFIPYPATWLRAERWADELPEAKPSPAKADWREECEREHGNRCSNVWFHNAVIETKKERA